MQPKPKLARKKNDRKNIKHRNIHRLCVLQLVIALSIVFFYCDANFAE